MDTVKKSKYLAPIVEAFSHQGVEKAIVKALETVFLQRETETKIGDDGEPIVVEKEFSSLEEQLDDLVNYGAPFLSQNPTVVERFAKQDGLAVLNRIQREHVDENGVLLRYSDEEIAKNQELSRKIMRIILANWSNLASERGLGFLRFILTMFWGDEWNLRRKVCADIDKYPQQLYGEKEPDNTRNTAGILVGWRHDNTLAAYQEKLKEAVNDGYFLTNRYDLSLAPNIPVTEIQALIPSVRKLVPANVVLRVIAEGTEENFDNNTIQVAMVAKIVQIVDLTK